MNMDGNNVDALNVILLKMNSIESNILITNLLALELRCVGLTQNLIAYKLVNLDKSINLSKTQLNICK